MSFFRICSVSLFPATFAILFGLNGDVLSGQTLVRTHSWTSLGFGQAVCNLGDVNGDFISDYAIVRADALGLGEVVMYSGADGTEIYVTSTGTGDGWGSEISRLGDLDGDGVADFGVSKDPDLCNCQSPIRVFSGATGQLIREMEGAQSSGTFASRLTNQIHSTQDLDGDGVQDVMVASLLFEPGGANRGLVTAYSGLTGQVLWTQDSAGIPGAFRIYESATYHDVDGDGVQDQLVRIRTFAPTMVAYNTLAVLSGATGAYLGLRDQGAPESVLSVRALGWDSDGDGIEDVLVGSRSGNTRYFTIFSGATHAFLVRSEVPDHPSYFVADSSLDMSGDGVPDLAVIGEGDASLFDEFYLLSGVDLKSLESEASSLTYLGNLGWSAVAALEDVDQDGRNELLIGNDGPGCNCVKLYSGISEVGQPFCQNAVPNGTGLPATLLAQGSLTVGNEWFSLVAQQLPQNSFGMFVCGTDQTMVTNIPGNMGVLCVGGTLGRFNAPNQIGFSGASGTVALELNLQAIPFASGIIPAQTGSNLNFQYWYRDPVFLSSNFSPGVGVTWQ